MKKTIIFQSVDERKLADTVNEIYAADLDDLAIDFKVASKLTADGQIVPLYIAFVTFAMKEVNAPINAN